MQALFLLCADFRPFQDDSSSGGMILALLESSNRDVVCTIMLVDTDFKEIGKDGWP